MIGERIKRLRLQENMSQKQLGDKIEVSKVSISNYEKGISYPKVQQILKLIDVFHVDANYLFGHDIDVISDQDPSLKIKMSQEEINIIQELKKRRELYNYVCENPPRTIEQFRKAVRK